MRNIIRLWNQYRRGIIVFVIAIALLIGLIQVLNQFAKRSKEQRVPNILTEEEKKLPIKSVIGGGSVSVEETKNNVNIIKSFVEKCNSRDLQGAYDMLSDGCKEALYPSLDLFKKNYYDSTFSTPKEVDIKNFLNRDGRETYNVTLYEDALAYGSTNNIKRAKDAFTIDQDQKLNIGNLIYRKEINKDSEKDGIKITVLAQEIYKENEVYEIKISNDTSKRILADTMRNTKSVYAIGENNVSYNSFIFEFSNILFEIPPRFERTYKIKFNKIYSNNIKTIGIAFTDIVPDYEQYSKLGNEMKDRLQISVKLK